jgi:polysaccharide chain length determinant protein (PEP-CTERM system associated)
MLGHRTLNVEDYVAILKRRWWVIAIPTILFPIIGFAITYSITPQYVSQTLVLIQQQQVPTDFVKSVIDQDLDSRLASMREQIESRALIQPIIEKYNLYGNIKASMDDRIDLVRADIGIKPIHSDVAQSQGLPGFFISFRANDAHTAQQVCDEITGLFVKQNLQVRQNAVEDTTNFMLSELADAKRTLDDQDTKLADFQRKYAGMLPTDESNNVSILGTLDTQLQADTQAIDQMEANKSYQEALLAQQSQAQATPTGTGPVAAQTPQAQQLALDKLLAQEEELSSHYQDDYPDLRAVRRKIADLRKQMAGSPANSPAPTTAGPTAPPPNRGDSASVQQLRAQLRGLTQAIDAKRKEQEQIQAQVRTYQARVEAVPQVELEFKELTRDNQTAHNNYDTLLANINKSKMATDLEKRQQGEQFKIMDAANLPDSPTYPKKATFAGAGLAAGIGMGLLITALIEYKDTALRSERDIWAFTQLPTLAVIAWSGEVAEIKPGKFARLKALFKRKPNSKELLGSTSG